MKKLSTVLLFALGITHYTQAQHVHSHRCTYEHAIEAMEQQHPGYRDAVNQTFEEAKRIGSLQSAQQRNVYRIPVVVHVVWNDPAENIPLSQIQDQLNVLNEDYRRLNSDTANLRSIFQPVVGDPQIEFDLIQVVRVQTTEIFQPTLQAPLVDQVKRSADGGSDAWDTDAYLNLWVCNIRPLNIFGQESPILGYAYPPAGLSNWPANSNAPSPELDGVVIDYRAFGRGLTFPIQGGSIGIEGRTACHEVGHYLGLRHIWGDGQLASFGIPDCNVDDGVTDTPNQGLGSQFNCDPTQNTCTDASNDKPDMIENYMDYSEESCMNSFTQGQIAIMRGVLEGPRIGLITNPASNNQLADIQGLSMFPNPADNQLNINIDADYAEPFILSVQDASGRVVLRQQVAAQAGAQQINTATWSNGLYLLRLSNNSANAVRKVLIQR
jgi:hypothetical protein